MNRNQVIGTIIGKVVGYTFQGILYCKVATAVSPKGVILLRAGTKCGMTVLRYTSKKYIRTDFRSEIILSDAIDAIAAAY